jgi:hypothetical protein
MAVDTGDAGGISLYVSLLAIAWTIFAGKRQDARDAKRAANESLDARERQIAAAVSSPMNVVHIAVARVAVDAAEESAKFVLAGEQTLRDRQLRSDIKRLEVAVLSGNRKLDALITNGARIHLRGKNMVHADEDADEES